jgi:large subunit ribosomal protein L4
MATSKTKTVKEEKPAKKAAAPKKIEKVEAAVKPTAVKGGIAAPMFDAKGAKDGTFNLPKEIFGGKINPTLMAQAVRVYLANQRQGTHSTKTRGEVEGSSKKIYRQKGTGGARHGSKRAPIFVKGGLVFGPKPRDYSLSLPQKMRKAALISALSQKVKDGEVIVLSGLTKIEPKTKVMAELIQKVTDDKKGKRKTLLVTSANPKELENVFRAGRNISNVEVLNAKFLNTYQVLKHKNLLFMKESIEVLSAPQGEVKGAK